MAVKWLVVDCPFNRNNYRWLIGRLYDTPPSFAYVERVRVPV